MTQKAEEEVFRGYFEECISHLSEEISRKYRPGTKGLGKERSPIAEFCGVGTQAVNLWLKGFHLPRGEQRIRLMCYLHVIGYRVIELENMPKNLRFFLELIGYGLLSGREATSLLGFAEDATLYKVLGGATHTSEGRTHMMWNIWKERKEELELKKLEARQHYGRGASHKKPKVNKPEVPSLTKTPPSKILPATTSIMEGLATLLEEDGFQEILETELPNYPEAADTFLRLWGRLSTYCTWLIRNDHGRVTNAER